MANQRDAIAMTSAEVATFFAEPATLQVASIGPHGWPHLAAMYYVVVDDLITFWTYAASQKVVNLRRDPRLTVMVERGDAYDDLRGVVVEGTARIVDEHDTVMEVGRLLAARYEGEAIGADRIATSARKRVAIQVLPNRVRSWDHGKLRRPST